MLCDITRHGDFTEVKMGNDSGMIVELLSFGACLKKVALPVNGVLRTITMTFSDDEEYTVHSTGNCGKTLAPNAGEIGEKNGIALNDGSEIHPLANRNGNSLHGGAHAGNVRNWTLLSNGADDSRAYAEFYLELPDGLDGWSGNRKFYVCYSLDNEDSLCIDLSAETDQTTYINMSNHAYWNLDDDPSKAMEQILFVDTEGMYFNGDDSLPEQVVSIDEILYESGIDFRQSNSCSKLIAPTNGEYAKQVLAGKGIDNAFSLRKGREIDQRVCELISADQKLCLELFTDAPDLVIYMAGSLKADLLLENGKMTCRNCAVALEAQEIPNLKVNRPLFPGEVFHRTIRYRIKRR